MISRPWIGLLSALLLLSTISVWGAKIADCLVESETLDERNQAVHDLLQDIRTHTFFKIFRVNLYNDCPFWREDSQCQRQSCSVCICEDDEVPEHWRIEKTDFVDRTLSQEFITGWREEDRGVWIDHDNTAEMSFINLQLNPESYTGYEGFAAHRIWSAIYDENCFEISGQDVCLEKRVFYRLISGLHAAISAHISSQYPVNPHSSVHDSNAPVAPNLDQFERRIGSFPDRLENLYFLNVFMHRALNKARDVLLTYPYQTGNETDDVLVTHKIQTLLDSPLISACSRQSFDEMSLFTGPDSIALKKQFKAHFRNISKIMDCVGCEKCKLHGKLQILGIGTALKILFSPPEWCAVDKLQRTEILALIVSAAKFSHALHLVHEFFLMRAVRLRNTAAILCAIVLVVFFAIIVLIRKMCGAWRYQQTTTTATSTIVTCAAASTSPASSTASSSSSSLSSTSSSSSSTLQQPRQTNAASTATATVPSTISSSSSSSATEEDEQQQAAAAGGSEEQKSMDSSSNLSSESSLKKRLKSRRAV